MKMKNLTLINKVQGRFDMIYNYTDVCGGDHPLNVLDDALVAASIYDQFSQFQDALNDDLDPSLTKSEYNALYECMHAVVLELRDEYGRIKQS